MTSQISSRGCSPPLLQSRARLPLRRPRLASPISCRGSARFSGTHWHTERPKPRQGCGLDKALVPDGRLGERTSPSCSSTLLQQIRAQSATSTTRRVCCAASSTASASAAPDTLGTWKQTIHNCSWIWASAIFAALLTSGKQAAWGASFQSS